MAQVADCGYSITGYDRHMSLIKRNQNNGLIIFGQQGLKFDLYEYGYEEGNILKLSVLFNNKTICIYCVYKSPANNINEFITKLRYIFDTEKSDNECNVLIGDINIDIKGNINNEY